MGAGVFGDQFLDLTAEDSGSTKSRDHAEMSRLPDV